MMGSHPVEKLACFDLEIAKPIPQGATSWDPYFPVGISCAALALEGEAEPRIWQGTPRMAASQVSAMLDELQQFAAAGCTLLTWNGCKFDFRVVGEECGRWAEAASLAADHIDLMLMFSFQQGHFLGLDRALQGSGIQGKRKTVTLNSGETIHDMDGARAPQLWAEGETGAVLAYLRDDVLLPIRLARAIEKTRRMRWASRSGSWQEAPFDRLYTVRECFKFPLPDTSWMSSPPRREDFISWMHGGKLP